MVVDTIGLLTMATVALGILFVSLAFGSGISRINGLAYAGVALLIGALIWLGAILFSSQLESISFFQAYVSTYQQFTPQNLLVFGNPALTAVFSFIGIIELGMMGGYGIGRHYRVKPEVEEQVVGQRSTSFPTSRPGFQQGMLSRQPEQFVPSAPTTIEASNDPVFLNSPFSSDEKTIAQLLLFGGVPEIKPRFDDKVPGGFYFDQLQSLDWDTRRQVSALNSLAKRGFLLASPKEKILHCRSCNSTNLEFRGSCPECGSLALSKHKVIEHFSCGMIDRESAFKTPNGDLLCPKCNKKLELIGNDYRSLGLMYVCQNCGALSKDLLSNLKCRDCGFSTTPDEERDEFVFSYSLNRNMLPRLRQLVKPIESVVNHFKSLGYVVYSPSFVRGKSGTDQVFDLMIYRSSNNEKILIEILASDKAIDLEEITREYGKIGDVNYPTVVFAVPSLSEKARGYASAYGINIVQGRTIDQALVNARIDSISNKVQNQPTTTFG